MDNVINDAHLLQSLADALGLTITFRTENSNLWNAALQECPYVPSAYTNSSLEYQLAYHKGHGGDWSDLSVLLFWKDSLAGVFPLSVSRDGLRTSITSQGSPVHPPLFHKALPSTETLFLSDLCLRLLYRLAARLHISSFTSIDSFTNLISLSEWHIASRDHAATSQLQHDIYLKICDSLDQTEAGFRRTLRTRIKQASQLWTSETLTHASGNIESTWAEFQQLHLAASGRQTRSNESWLLQRDAIMNDEAFLVYLRDTTGVMVGGGLFNFSRDEGVYSVAAYDRSLFDKPIGHLVQHEAIKQFVARHIRWYGIGHYPYPSDIPAPTDKELSIAHFKKQFSSHIFPKFILTHTVRPDGETARTCPSA